MRNFEQRLGEIQRRGEELKRKRKNRQRMLAACIPLALCASLCAVLLPDFKTAPAAGENHNPAGVVGESYSETQTAPSVSLLVQQVRVEGQHWKTTHTDVAALEKITQLLVDITCNEQSYPHCTVTNPAQAGVDPAYTGGGGVLKETMGYIVTVTAEEEIWQFSLVGSTLRDLLSGETYTMDEKKLIALKDALGIPYD